MTSKASKLEEGIRNAMDERGITNPNESWRIKITNRYIINNSDLANVTVEVYKPRARKWAVIWILRINFVRNIIQWDKSTFISNN